jgi:hypothetical protein
MLGVERRNTDHALACQHTMLLRTARQRLFHMRASSTKHSQGVHKAGAERTQGRQVAQRLWSVPRALQ